MHVLNTQSGQMGTHIPIFIFQNDQNLLKIPNKCKRDALKLHFPTQFESVINLFTQMST